MPATQFQVDVSKPGQGVSITTSDLATQQIIKDGETLRNDGSDTWVKWYLRRGSRIIETVVLNTGNGLETYHIMTKIESQP